MITHLACVMDGNRRWAKQQNLMPWLGHKAGAKTVEMVIRFCLQQKIQFLSLYTFSLENFKRSYEEKSFLFDLVIAQAEQHLDMFMSQGIKIKFVGDLSQFPVNIIATCQRVEQATADGAILQVNFLFGYGGRQEIFHAAQRLCQQSAEGQAITQKLFENNLWTVGVPDPDLIVRTGGVKRLSNFLLYQASYAEICFLDMLWPDLTEQDLLKALASAIQAQKNIGK